MSTHQHNFTPSEGLSVSCDCGLYLEGDEIIEAVLFWLNGKKLREQNTEMMEALEDFVADFKNGISSHITNAKAKNAIAKAKGEIE